MFAELKIRGYDIEHIPEFVKTWAYEGRKPRSYDQLYIFAQQLHMEDLALRHVARVVTDSPVLLSPIYAKLYGFSGADRLVELAQQFEQDFPSINFYIERTVVYQSSGRYQTYAEAVEFDKQLLEFLDTTVDRYVKVQVEQFDQMLALILQEFAHG